MRFSWIAIPAFLALAACGDDNVRNESAGADKVLADDRLTGNDLTAIDAVSGSDANMAADIDLDALANNATAEDGDRTSSPSRERSRPASRAAADGDAEEPDNAPAPTPSPAESNSN